MTDDELTPSEKKAFESLPKERTPSAFLEERVVRTLTRHGVLHSREGHRFIRITGRRIAGAVAASAAFVICGFALGYWASARPVYVSQTIVPGGAGEPVALSVQEAGTDYILALEKLAAHTDSTQSEEMRQGREVALNTLYTATDQMLKIVPREVLARCIANAIAETETGNGQPSGSETRPRVIQF
jgi:hypothetical protein